MHEQQLECKWIPQILGNTQRSPLQCVHVPGLIFHNRLFIHYVNVSRKFGQGTRLPILSLNQQRFYRMMAKCMNESIQTLRRNRIMVWVVCMWN